MLFAGNSCSSNPASCLKHEQLPSSCGNETLQQCSRELPAASLGVTSFPRFVIALHHQPFSYHLISFIGCSLLWIPLNYKSFKKKLTLRIIRKKNILCLVRIPSCSKMRVLVIIINTTFILNGKCRIGVFMWQQYTGTHTHNVFVCSVHSDTKNTTLYSFLTLLDSK